MLEIRAEFDVVPGRLVLDWPAVGEEGSAVELGELLLATVEKDEAVLETTLDYEETALTAHEDLEDDDDVVTVVENAPGSDVDTTEDELITPADERLPQRPYCGSQPVPQYSVVLPQAPYWLQQSPKLRPQTAPSCSGPQ